MNDLYQQRTYDSGAGYRALTEEESERQSRVHDQATRFAVTAAGYRPNTGWRQRHIRPALVRNGDDVEYQLTVVLRKDRAVLLLGFTLEDGEFQQATRLRKRFLDSRPEVEIELEESNARGD